MKPRVICDPICPTNSYLDQLELPHYSGQTLCDLNGAKNPTDYVSKQGTVYKRGDWEASFWLCFVPTTSGKANKSFVYVNNHERIDDGVEDGNCDEDNGHNGHDEHDEHEGRDEL